MNWPDTPVGLYINIKILLNTCTTQWVHIQIMIIDWTYASMSLYTNINYELRPICLNKYIQKNSYQLKISGVYTKIFIVNQVFICLIEHIHKW